MAEQIETRNRKEAIQRIQIGLIGLGAVLLVVTFANLVVRSIHPETAQTLAATGQQQTDATEPNSTGTGTDTEPLADLGVTPKSDQSTSPSVPDLEPDPRLSKPMDQDPNKRAASGRH